MRLNEKSYSVHSLLLLLAIVELRSINTSLTIPLKYVFSDNLIRLRKDLYSYSYIIYMNRKNSICFLYLLIDLVGILAYNLRVKSE